MALTTFYWLDQGALAGCSRPGLRAAGRGATDAALADDLAWLRDRGIAALLSLTEAPLPAPALAAHGLVARHLPVPDLCAPSRDDFIRALGFLDEQRALGRPVAVHCRMGQGRTGTILAAHLIRAGWDAGAALEALRAACPGAIGRPAQESALRAFAAGRHWLL
ncbi:MAG TPA: dual specificity protein phosphatase family protein [Thermomicrobiales bacterium]|nr:dual specificity protein phosphatase family protein [Thermomicrobiales bacterium]